MPIGNPNFYIVDANGNATAQFAGHISADGVDLVAGNAAAPPNDRQIRWHKDTITGASVAEVFGWYAAPTSQFRVNARSPVDPSLSAGLFVNQSDTVNQPTTGIFASTDGPTGTRTILNANGSSTFLAFGSTTPGGTAGKSQVGSGVLIFAAGAVQSTPVNVSPTGGTPAVGIALATCNTFTGLDCSIEAINGGNFFQFLGYLRTATPGPINVNFSYIMTYL